MITKLQVCKEVTQSYSILLRRLPRYVYKSNSREMYTTYSAILQGCLNGSFESGCVATQGVGNCITYSLFVIESLKRDEPNLDQSLLHLFGGYYTTTRGSDFHVGFCYEHQDENNATFGYTFWDGSRPEDHKHPLFLSQNQTVFKDNTKCITLKSIHAYFLQQMDHRNLSSHDGPYGTKQLGLFTIVDVSYLRSIVMSDIADMYREIIGKTTKSTEEWNFITLVEQFENQ